MLSVRSAWYPPIALVGRQKELELSTGVTVRLGRRQVDERMDRFVQFGVQVISGRAAEVRYVDMRYSNGFAIGWRGNRKPQPVRTARTAGPTNGDPGFDG